MYRTYTRLHVDLDSFFLSVELRERPDLRGRPCAVGGPPGTRSVVLSASYEARGRGVRAGIPVEQALRLCPGLVLLPPRHDLYRKVSAEVMEHIGRWSPDHTVESVDEVSLDVGRVLSLHGPSVRIAKAIRASLPRLFGLTCSVGVAPNRFLAKFASDLRKPDGLTVLGPSCFERLTETMPVERLPGVGPRTAESLQALGIRTIGELRRAPRDLLEAHFGVHGLRLGLAARGEELPSPAPALPRSVGRETTLSRDTSNPSELLPVLLALVEEVCMTLRQERLKARTVQLKAKYYDFRPATRSLTLAEPTDLEEEVFGAVKSLLPKLERRPVRLVGVALSGLVPAEAGQPSLFGEAVSDGKRERLARAADDIRLRFGPSALRRASTLRPDGPSSGSPPASSGPDGPRPSGPKPSRP